MAWDTKRVSDVGIILSKTEKIALSKSSFKVIYPPAEKIPAIVVECFPSLGKLAAVRFLEWVQQNQGGVISLPTGKTPEYFIKWVRHFISGWNKPDIRKAIDRWGIDPAKKPDMKSLNFVQIDEFYPMDSGQENSFYHYVSKYYIEGFGLDPKKAMLIDASRIGLRESEDISDIWPDNRVDLTLRYRHSRGHLEQKQKRVLEAVDEWCMEYEERIRRLGGIGFFLGGIGPDGHIGFNIRGSDHNSTTRLCPINYETQAAAAVDLGGIETGRNCLVVTIGLRTITRNKNCTAIIIAAGAAKSSVVASAVQSEIDIEVPATVLQKLPNARFYITQGAAGGLIERQLELAKAKKTLSDADAERILTNLAENRRKQITELTESDVKDDQFAQILLSRRSEGLADLTQTAKERLIEKIENGMTVLENKCFLHTEPHHDDIMLGYFAHVVRHFRRSSNTHHFMTLTSGFTSVTNRFMTQQLCNLQEFLRRPSFAGLLDDGYFSDAATRNRDIWRYLDGVASRNERIKNDGCARRLLRDLVEEFDESFLLNVDERIAELLQYFRTAYPGKHDPAYIQRLKGMCREWEVECLWGYYGWNCDNVRHLRLGFYKGDIFTEDPTLESDVPPIVEAMDQINPDIVTVALDPEASGPDTHYKVLQTIAEALKIYEKRSGKKDIKVWGYRNVWYRFEPAEANIFVPVSLCMFSVMQEAFQNAFLSQREASFPSYEHDGPFSELAQRIQVQQYQKIKTCLGRQWFYNHSSPLIRATRGFVFLKEMEPEEFYRSCRELKRFIENGI